MKKLSEIFGIEIKNEKLFKQALTHPSYTQEQGLPYCENYERLEFLGDAVLKLIISDILFEKYPAYAEGKLSQIRSIVVSDATLFKISQKLELPEMIILAKHEQGCRNLESVCACAFEAILGAYYLDGQLEEIKDFANKIFISCIENVDKNFAKFNAKAILQEYTQSLTKETPVYTIINTLGPAHDKTFEVEVRYKEMTAKGIGKTKKEAEQHAAYNACKILELDQ